MTRIALDASGGDHAPEIPVVGALEAVHELPRSCEIALVGSRADIEATLSTHEGVQDRILIVDAPETIGMGEKPLQAVRTKSRSSIVIGLEMQKRGEADAFISAGNTGAVMAASMLLLGMHDGIERPAIATVLPTVSQPVLLLDAGANVDSSPRELLGFAHLGAVYARDLMGRHNPTVGLLNNGEEEEKGNAAVREAYELLRREETDTFRFIGNVEGDDIILTDPCDVVVCDGFVGNTLLKFYESVGLWVVRVLQRELEPKELQSDSVRRLLKVLDYSEWGGAPLLGVRGVCVVCHGRSSSRAIKNALQVAFQSADRHLSEHISEEFMAGGAAA